MNKQTVIAIALFILFTTITPSHKIRIAEFNLQKIEIDNNFLIKEKELKNLLSPFYSKNLLFLKNEEIEKILMKNSLIESFEIKKKYPNTLKIKIFEKKPFAILLNKKNKFYLSEKIDLIEFSNLKEYQNLPYVLGNKDEFKIIYENLKKINFPLNLIKKYTLYESKRWDLETTTKKIIKLPQNDYIKSLENFLYIREKNDLKKYTLFDYRIQDQLILK